MKNLLLNLKNTLNKVEVRGQNNLDMLLGCMMTIDRAIAELDKQAAAAAEAEKEGVHDDTNERGDNARG